MSLTPVSYKHYKVAAPTPVGTPVPDGYTATWIRVSPERSGEGYCSPQGAELRKGDYGADLLGARCSYSQPVKRNVVETVCCEERPKEPWQLFLVMCENTKLDDAPMKDSDGIL